MYEKMSVIFLYCMFFIVSAYMAAVVLVMWLMNYLLLFLSEIFDQPETEPLPGCFSIND